MSCKIVNSIFSATSRSNHPFSRSTPLLNLLHQLLFSRATLAQSHHATAAQNMQPAVFWHFFTFFMASIDSRIKNPTYTITFTAKNRNRLFKFNPNVVGRFSTNFFKGCLIRILYGMFFRIYHCNHG